MTSRLTANHNGQFRFKLCNMDNENESDACFEKNLILTEDGKPFFQLPDQKARDFHHQIKLPAEISCEHCVLQWTYKTANNWGKCDDGTGAVGEFYPVQSNGPLSI